MHRDDQYALKSGLSLIEVLVVVGIIGMLLMLFLPNVRMARGAARRTQCGNNLKSISLALINYESANSRLPVAVGAYDDGLSVDDNGYRRLSGMISLLPHMEERALFETISRPSEFNGVRYPAMGPEPWNEHFPPWSTQVFSLKCPASPEHVRTFGITNYAFCIGDTVRDIHKPIATRGAFGCRQELALKDIKDGTSKTMAFGEIGTSPKGSRIPQFLINQPIDLLTNPRLCNSELDEVELFSRDGRGGRWADGSAGYSLFNSVLPPNSSSCAVAGEDAADGVYSAGSCHAGDYILVAMLDGSVQAVNGGIDAGDASNPNSVASQGIADSPFGIWGAMGTVAGGENAK